MLQVHTRAVPAVGRPTEPELAHRVAVEAAAAQVLASDAAFGRLEQQLLVERDRGARPLR